MQVRVFLSSLLTCTTSEKEKMHLLVLFVRELLSTATKVHFFKERTWQNQFIQKFAKMASSIRCCVGGPFLQLFG